MALDVETGHFTKNNGGVNGDTNVVSTGFQAKALIVWASYESEANSETDDHAIFSMGFSDGTNHRSGTFRIEDAVARSDSARDQRNDACIDFASPTATSSLAHASVVFNATDMTFTWDLADTKATIIHYIIYGGSDITGIQVSDFAKSTTATPPDVDQQITTDADVQSITEGQGVVFLLMMKGGSFQNFFSNSTMSFGMATKLTEEGCIWCANDDNTANAEARQKYEESLVIIGKQPTTGANQFLGEFNGFNSSGFKVNWTLNNTGSSIVSYLIIKGGSWQVGNETARTTVGTKATTTDFQPKGLFNCGVQRTAVGDAQEDLSWNFGAASSPTTEEYAGVTDNDLAATMETGASSNILKVTRILNATTTSPTVNGEASLDSFNATDFTLDWTDAATAAFKFLWCVCGDIVGLTAIGRTFNIRHDISEFVGRTFNLRHDLAEFVNRTFNIRHDILVLVGRTFNIRHDIKVLVERTFNIRHDLAEFVGRTFNLRHDLAGAVGRTFNIRHDVAEFVGRIFNIRHDILILVGRTFTVRHDILILVNRTFNIRHDISELVGRTFNIRHDIKVLVERTFNIRHDLAEFVGRTFNLRHDLAGAVGRTFNIRHDVAEFVGRIFNIRHDILILVGRTFTVRHDILILVNRTFNIRHDISELVGRTFNIRHDIILVATFKITGVTYKGDGTATILGTVICRLHKDNLDNTSTFVDEVISNAVTGVYEFLGITDDDPQYYVTGWKDGSPNEYDMTDHTLTPEAE